MDPNLSDYLIQVSLGLVEPVISKIVTLLLPKGSEQQKIELEKELNDKLSLQIAKSIDETIKKSNIILTEQNSLFSEFYQTTSMHYDSVEKAHEEANKIFGDIASALKRPFNERQILNDIHSLREIKSLIENDYFTNHERFYDTRLDFEEPSLNLKKVITEITSVGPTFPSVDGSYFGNGISKETYLKITDFLDKKQYESIPLFLLNESANSLMTQELTHDVNGEWYFNSLPIELPSINHKNDSFRDWEEEEFGQRINSDKNIFDIFGSFYDVLCRTISDLIKQVKNKKD